MFSDLISFQVNDKIQHTEPRGIYGRTPSGIAQPQRTGASCEVGAIFSNVVIVCKKMADIVLNIEIVQLFLL